MPACWAASKPFFPCSDWKLISTHSLMLWDGIRSHGIGWISGWKFTQDNWLLSLLPLHFLAFSLFGPKISIVVVFGWVIFVFSALCAGAIAWRLGLRTAAVASTVVLLNLNSFAHMRGFVSFSTSHNITNLFGLLCVLAIVHWLESRSALLLSAISLLLVAGAVSDPWMLASYVAPMGILGVGLIVFSMSRKRRVRRPGTGHGRHSGNNRRLHQAMWTIVVSAGRRNQDRVCSNDAA